MRHHTWSPETHASEIFAAAPAAWMRPIALRTLREKRLAAEPFLTTHVLFRATCRPRQMHSNREQLVSTEKHFLIDNEACKQIIFGRSGSFNSFVLKVSGARPSEGAQVKTRASIPRRLSA